MSYVGGGWRSGRSTDPAVNTGAASTATVTTLSPTSAVRTSGLLTLTVNGTGFTNQTKVYANYSPQTTTYVSATQLTVARFSPMPDSGADGAIPIGVVKPGEKISNTVNFTAGVATGTNYNETGRSVAIVSTVAVTDTYHAGATVSAVRFDASTDRYSRTASGLGASFTMCCWVKIMASRGTYTMALAQGNGSTLYYHFGFGNTGVLFTRDSTSGGSANSTVSFTVGTWYYIATVNDTGAGNDLMGYKQAGGAWNPVTVPAATVTGPADANTFYIGSDSFNDWLNGSIAAVKIWDVALTDAELQAEAFTYAPVKTSGLWAAYAFRNGPQTTDDSGNGRTLTAGGTLTTDTSGPPIT